MLILPKELTENKKEFSKKEKWATIFEFPKCARVKKKRIFKKFRVSNVVLVE